MRENCVLYTFDLYFSPNIQVIKLRSWAGHTTHGEKKYVYRVLVGKHEEKNCSQHLSMGERIMLKWILTGLKDMGWIHLVQDRDKWQTLTNII